MTPREKVLRDALEDIAAKGGRTQHRNGCICEACIARAALAAADAIPDAPAEYEPVAWRCGDCEHRNEVEMKNCEECWSACDDRAVPIYRAPVECPPVPSRAELIELMTFAAYSEHRPIGQANRMALVLDALIKAGAVRT